MPGTSASGTVNTKISKLHILKTDFGKMWTIHKQTVTRAVVSGQGKDCLGRGEKCEHVQALSPFWKY